LYKACKTSEERYLIAVLFDTGARAEEFHNIRFEDIDIREEKVRLTLKEEYSNMKVIIRDDAGNSIEREIKL